MEIIVLDIYSVVLVDQSTILLATLLNAIHV